MPVNYIKHGEFTFDDEKVEEIAKNILLVNKKRAVLGRFFSPTARLNGDQIIKRRQVLIDPTAIASLNEGETPREDQIKIVTFSEKVRSCGSFIGFTRHAKKRNRDDILEMCRVQLAHNRLYDMEAIRFIALNSTPNQVTVVTSGGKAVWWDTFANARIRLQKNKGKGDLVFLCTPEVEAHIAAEAKAANTLIQSTPEGVKLFGEGYVGKYAGFNIVTVSEAYMYDGDDYLCYFIAKTEAGQWPLVETGLNEGNVEVIVHDIGDGGHQDPTNEVGTIASRIDYVGAYLEHPELVLAATVDDDYVMVKVAGDLPEDYEIQAHADSGVGAGRDNAEWQKVIAGIKTFALTVTVVDGSGDAIASPSVTIKKGSSTGDTVSAGADGKYTLDSNKIYYYSVGKSGYRVSATAENSTSHTGTFKADPTQPELHFVLVANSAG